MKTTIIVVIAIMLVILILGITTKFNIWGGLNDYKIGKNIYLDITKSDNIDFKAINEGCKNLSLLNIETRNKLSSYMKENNLKITAGEYKLNQTNKFDDALKILNFEKIN